MTMNKEFEDHLSDKQKELLAYPNKNVRILENLEFSIKAGLLILKNNGQLDWPSKKKPDRQTHRQYHAIYHPINRRICLFNNKFLYRLAYGEACIPFGCKDCFKVKVIPRTLIELTSLLEIANGLSFTAKFGFELKNRLNRSGPYQYAAYFYFVDLKEAKKAYATISKIIDASHNMGEDVKILIKRGCTHFEMKFGPSNKWTFDTGFEAIESLLEHFYHGECRRTKLKKENKHAVSKEWLALVSQAVDENNTANTKEKKKYPKIVTYHDVDEDEILIE